MAKSWMLNDLTNPKMREQVEKQLGNPVSALVIPQAVAAEPKSRMNGLETRYGQKLDELIERGGVAAWRFEAINLRLADATFYRPDFLVILKSGHIEFHETKGYWREDARVKIKVAASLYPWFTFVAIQEKNGVFIIEQFEPR